MALCRNCRNDAQFDWLDFGEQAVTNRLLRERDEPQFSHSLALGACSSCGTMQLKDIAPVSELRPRFEWIAYNEPEAHLDEVVDIISKLPELKPNSTIAGLTGFDASTLRRLRELGFSNTWLADRRDDLGVDDACAGTESIQEALSVSTARRLIERHGRPDVVILRYVLEHAHDVHEMLGCLKTLVSPQGYIVLEMPDARGALDRRDYSTVWEEHAFYFAPATLQKLLVTAGFEIVFLQSFACGLDHPLVAIVKPAAPEKVQEPVGIAEEFERGHGFVRDFPKIRARVERTLMFRRAKGKLAFLGAGHLSAAFINLYGLQELFDIVVDDNVDKQGLFMPGSRLPILPAHALTTHEIGTCVMGVRPEVEDAVLRKNDAFIRGGGQMVSIFAESRYSLWAADKVNGIRKAG